MPDPITILRKDHREAEELIKRLEASSTPGPRRRQTVDKLASALLLHMEIEERLVYPVAAEAIGSESVREADNEHALARDGLRQLEKLVGEPGFGAAVAMVKAGIKHHIREEEREMFPQLKKKVDSARLRELGEQVAAMKAQGSSARAA